jgi:cell wall-associated NlpC family hydrolase
VTELTGAFIDAARSLIGAPFEMGGRDPERGIDCVGVVVYAAEAAGRQCPRLAAGAATVRRWWPSLPPPAARPELDAALIAALDDDLCRVKVAEVEPGDAGLFQFHWIGGRWHHVAVLDADDAGAWWAIHADPYTKDVQERPLIHPRWPRMHHALASWERSIVRGYRLRAAPK